MGEKLLSEESEKEFKSHIQAWVEEQKQSEDTLHSAAVKIVEEEKVDDYNEELFLLGIIEWCRGHLKDAQDSMRGYALVNKDNRNKVFSRIAEFKRLLLGHNVTQVEYAMMLNLIDNHFTAK